ncbi:F-box/kelch-repeat protein At3g06240-like [Papaver somniferum]|uniref:F-box/kelch-repeat protein At3g06240-like n=1 Tax=Papaver somniferum TaxID=3469 RepID=UPI000E70407F|nr:F-box/kelch-repeat protein At3g06240-like [Papaver somniferum]XP_026420655.1 F-box/kelch-repeat protein At3g06240-like [Papaver somniferum]
MDRFNLLPAEITSDILTRLPAESVLDCKLVSKTWKNVIQHRSFSKLHTIRLLNHSATTYSTDFCKLSFLAFTDVGRLYYFDYIENHEIPNIDRIMRINLTSPFKYNVFVGSFNGLICLRGREERFCIYNPITKEYVILPQPKINFRQCKDRCIGFGYLPLTNEYKVVLMYKVPNFVEVMVYTLGNGSGWRNLGKFKIELGYAYAFEVHGIFANGDPHWIHRRRTIFLVFDLAGEKFRKHLARPPLTRGCSYSDFGVLGGFLFCAHRRYDSVSQKFICSKFWLYKQKNGNCEWSQNFTAICTAPLAFTKSGGIFSYSSSYLNSLKRLLGSNEQFVQIFSHKNSLVSLKDLGEEGSEIMQQSVKLEKRKRCD